MGWKVAARSLVVKKSVQKHCVHYNHSIVEVVSGNYGSTPPDMGAILKGTLCCIQHKVPFSNCRAGMVEDLPADVQWDELVEIHCCYCLHG